MICASYTHRVETRYRARTLSNRNAAWVTQSGSQDYFPLWKAGLQGQDEIIGVADTGICSESDMIAIYDVIGRTGRSCLWTRADPYVKVHLSHMTIFNLIIRRHVRSSLCRHQAIVCVYTCVYMHVNTVCIRSWCETARFSHQYPDIVLPSSVTCVCLRICVCVCLSAMICVRVWICVYMRLWTCDVYVRVSDYCLHIRCRCEALPFLSPVSLILVRSPVLCVCGRAYTCTWSSLCLFQPWHVYICVYGCCFASGVDVKHCSFLDPDGVSVKPSTFRDPVTDLTRRKVTERDQYLDMYTPTRTHTLCGHSKLHKLRHHALIVKVYRADAANVTDLRRRKGTETDQHSHTHNTLA